MRVGRAGRRRGGGDGDGGPDVPGGLEPGHWPQVPLGVQPHPWRAAGGAGAAVPFQRDQRYCLRADLCPGPSWRVRHRPLLRQQPYRSAKEGLPLSHHTRRYAQQLFIAISNRKLSTMTSFFMRACWLLRSGECSLINLFGLSAALKIYGVVTILKGLLLRHVRSESAYSLFPLLPLFSYSQSVLKHFCDVVKPWEKIDLLKFYSLHSLNAAACNAIKSTFKSHHRNVISCNEAIVTKHKFI